MKNANTLFCKNYYQAPFKHHVDLCLKEIGIELKSAWIITQRATDLDPMVDETAFTYFRLNFHSDCDRNLFLLNYGDLDYLPMAKRKGAQGQFPHLKPATFKSGNYVISCFEQQTSHSASYRKTYYMTLKMFNNVKHLLELK